jgi:hypothetical protein
MSVLVTGSAVSSCSSSGFRRMNASDRCCFEGRCFSVEGKSLAHPCSGRQTSQMTGNVCLHIAVVHAVVDATQLGFLSRVAAGPRSYHRGHSLHLACRRRCVGHPLEGKTYMQASGLDVVRKTNLITLFRHQRKNGISVDLVYSQFLGYFQYPAAWIKIGAVCLSEGCAIVYNFG